MFGVTGLSVRRWITLLDQRWVHFLFIAFLAVASAVGLERARWRPARALDALSLDTYFALRGAHSPADVADRFPATRDIIIVETNHTLPRSVLAKLVEHLRLAKVVALDFMLVDNEAPLQDEDEKALYKNEIGAWRRNDALLARALRRAGNVVLGTWPEEAVNAPTAPTGTMSGEVTTTGTSTTGTSTTGTGTEGNGDSGYRLIWERPPPELWKQARYHAHLRVEPNSQDGVVRSVPLFENTPQRTPCLGLAMAAAALGIAPDQLEKGMTHNDFAHNDFVHVGPWRIPARDNSLLVNYVGGRQCFEYDTNRIVYQNVFHTDPEDFEGKIMLVGESSLKAKEITMTPFGAMPSMQVHANVAATLLGAAQPGANGHTGTGTSKTGVGAKSGAGPKSGARHAVGGTLHEMSLGVTGLLALGGCLLLVVPLLRWPLWASLLAAAAQGILLLLLGAWLFSGWNQVLPLAVPFIALFLMYNSIALYEYRRARETLGKFIGRDMVPQALHIFARLQPGGREEVATALFCDLRGYSKLVEELPARRVVQITNQYTETLVEVVRRHQGQPIDYQGDGVFVLFDPAVAGPDHAAKAIAAGIELQKELATLRDRWVREGAPPLTAGVGVATGPMTIGLVGSAHHLKRGAMGDAVNVAAHIQRLDCSAYHAVLMTRDTYQEAQDVFPAEACGLHSLKGHTRPVEVFGVAGEPNARLPLAEGDQVETQCPESQP